MSEGVDRPGEVVEAPAPRPTTAGVEPGPAPLEVTRATRAWWDREAVAYQAEHGRFLAGERGSPGPTAPSELPGRLVWGPEGLDEADVRWLGRGLDLPGPDVLEVGAGAAQGSRWVAEQGARAVALDLSAGMLALRGGEVPAVVADACRAAAAPTPGGPGLLGLRCAALRRRRACGPRRGGPGATPRRPVRAEHHAPLPLGDARRPRAGTAYGCRCRTSTAVPTSSVVPTAGGLRRAPPDRR